MRSQTSEYCENGANLEPASLLWTWKGREDGEDGERQRLWARVEQKGSFGSSGIEVEM